MWNTLTILASIIACGIGFLAGMWFWNRARKASVDLRVQVSGLEARLKSAEQLQQRTLADEQRMREVFSAAASDVLKGNSEALTRTSETRLQSVVTPLNDHLKKLDQHVRDLESTRKGDYSKINLTLTNLNSANENLRSTTASLAEALRSPTMRGKWGEMELRRIVEWAGMTNHVHFEEQFATESGRPDMMIRQAHGGSLPVDSKVPMNAYLLAIEETGNEQARKSHFVNHAKAVRSHAGDLGKKEYWKQFERAPEFVVMLVPFESCLTAAFEYEPDLFEYAMERKVLIVSPITLVALLRAFAYGWQQQKVAESAAEIVIEGRKLYDRIEVFVSHFQGVGQALNKATDKFNSARASFDSRLRPSARKFLELGIRGDELSALEEIDITALGSDTSEPPPETTASQRLRLNRAPEAVPEKIVAPEADGLS